jgi:hydroxypyruvate isomerase
VKRREFLHAGVAAGVSAVGVAALGGPARAAVPGMGAAAARERSGALKQSVCRWPFSNLSLDELAAGARDIGLKSVELLNPDEWATVQKYGLTCALANAAGPGGIERGFNRIEHHEWLVPAYETMLARAADAGIPNVICFSGNRAGLSDEQGMDNCARGLARLTPVAERHGVMLVMELLNSRVDHRDYQCDRTPWGVGLVEKVGSENFKLLYDIYHMQIMEGDVIRTIRDNHRYIAHYHTAGNPGRNELNDQQELYYPAIMRAIRDTGFQGYVGKEFVPLGDPLTSLAEAVRLCDV